MIKDFIRTHKYIWIFPAYGIFYLISFVILENNLSENYALIHTKLDDLIPFYEGFIIFYYLWFFYMAVTFYFIITARKEIFMRTAVFLMIGMTLFLIISIVFPNGHDLRPVEFERNNIFTYLTGFIYSADPPRNLLPSIHVYNSIGCCIGFMYASKENEKIKDKKHLRVLSFIICMSITLSTLFVKQHSVVDVISAIILAVICFYPCFKSDLFKAKS